MPKVGIKNLSDITSVIGRDLHYRAGLAVQVFAANAYGFATGTLKIEGSDPAQSGFYDKAKLDAMVDPANRDGLRAVRDITDLDDFSDPALAVVTDTTPDTIAASIIAEVDTGLLVGSVSVGGMDMVKGVVRRLGKVNKDEGVKVVDALLEDASIKPYYKAAVMYELYGHKPWGQFNSAAKINKEFFAQLLTPVGGKAPKIERRS